MQQDKENPIMNKYVAGLVSAIIPTYKRSATVSRAIKSVLSQSYGKIECIVVNDNIPGDQYSNVLYQDLLQFEGDPRFRFVEQEKHINGAAARNAGIRASRGEYIAFLDDDDWWEPEKIKKQVEFISAQGPACGAVSTLLKFYNSNRLVRKSRPYRDGQIMFDILSRQADVTTCSVLVRRAAIEETGYFDTGLSRHQEIQFLSFLADKYEIRLLKEYLTCIDISASDNNPSASRLYEIKSDFFKAVQPLMDKLSNRDQKTVKALHAQEIALLEFREKNYVSALKQGRCIFYSHKAFCLAVKRVIKRIMENFNQA